jgi:hypothetical protein
VLQDVNDIYHGIKWDDLMCGKLETGSGCSLFQVNLSICFAGQKKTGKIMGIFNVGA